MRNKTSFPLRRFYSEEVASLFYEKVNLTIYDTPVDLHSWGAGPEGHQWKNLEVCLRFRVQRRAGTFKHDYTEYVLQLKFSNSSIIHQV